MASLNKDLVLLILQFLDEEKYKETVHKLEKESGVFFNMRYFEEIVTEGKWEEVEDYLKGFTKFDENEHSMLTFFEIRKIKYLEALDKHDVARAVKILREELEVFSANEKLYRQLTELLTLSDIRENKQLSCYTDAKAARAKLLRDIKKLIEANPLIRDKLQFPTVTDSRLRTLINQSLRWQHKNCKNPKRNPDVKTLFVNHSCDHGVYSSTGGLVPFQHAPAFTASRAGWMPNPSSVPYQAISMRPMGLPPLNNDADSEHLLYRSRPLRHFIVPEEVFRQVIGTFVASTSAAGPSMREDRNSPVAPAIALDGGSKLQYAESRISNELDKSKMWEPTEINEPVQLRNLMLPDSLLPIIRLIYTNSGSSILALAYNAVHMLWEWQQSERNASGKASISVPPKLWKPSSGILMTNDISETNIEKSVPCFALTKNDSYVLSASGGKITLFHMRTFETMTTLMPPPPAATFLAFDPQDNNVIAIGMDDSSIQIYNVQKDEVTAKLNGHKKLVTGLAFSSVLSVLVSSSADGQLCVWTLKGWEKRASKLLPIPTAATGSELNNNRQTRLQFHQDQMHVLVVHETQIAIYEAFGLYFINQWIAMEATHKITDATYSCDSQSIFTCFTDGSVYIFTAQGLKLRCRISPAAYMPSQPSFQNYPLVIASHPSEANQFALGMAKGGVHVLEPLESEGKWGTAPEQEQGAGTSKSGAGDQSAR